MNWEALVIALVPSLTIGILTYRLSRKKDAVSEQSGVASNHRAGTGQVIEGLNALIDQLQEESKTSRETNTAVREDIKLLAVRLEAATSERNAAITERDACRAEVARLRKRYGANDEAT